MLTHWAESIFFPLRHSLIQFAHLQNLNLGVLYQNMAWTETEVGSGRKRNGVVGENGSLKALRPSSDGAVTLSPVHLLPNKFEGKDALSYANILRSRNKFVDALVLYEGVLEKDGTNVEALIGKGISLQMQNMTQQAFESFTEAIRLDPQNACALTHCGILYKDEGHLMEAAEVCYYILAIF